MIRAKIEQQHSVSKVYKSSPLITKPLNGKRKLYKKIMQKVNPRPRKMLKKKQEFLEVNLSKDKNRYSIYYPATKNSQDIDTYKTMNKKSLEINNTQPVRALNTISQLSRPVYRRISYHQQNVTTTSKRYEEEDQQQNQARHKVSNPYANKKQLSQLGRTSILNRSSNGGSNSKIRSGSLTKQLSPYQLYKQPRSSLSQHYDPTLQTSLHKRRQSYIEEKNESLKIAKEYYKGNNFDKCCEFLRKYLRGNLGGDVVEAQYLLGMSLINKGEHKQGIESLQKVLQHNPKYKKTVFLIMALANKKLNQYQDAIDILTKGLELFPDYYDLIIYRGKMYLKEEQYQKSREDFISAIQINKHKGFAYLGKGTCEINLKMIDQAIKTFTQGIETDLAHVCYQKRGICHYEQQNYTKSLNDLEQASMYDHYFSSALHYYKGMIYYKQKNTTEALLCFEQCLKCDNNKQLVTLGIEMMLRIKIEDKDFYQAYHIINRAENVDVDRGVIEEWKMFLEASLFLMKKKYKDALETYENLEKRELYQLHYPLITAQSHKERYKFVKPLIHLYKAFGYLSQSQPQKALLQYEYHSAVCKSMQVSTDNLSKRYNTLIVLAGKSFPNNITDLLIQAVELIPTKPEPYLFLSFDQLQQTLKITNLEERQNSIKLIIQNLSTGITHLPQLSNNHISSFYYFRAILELYQQDFSKAVSDVDKAIEKSEDNIPKYFYLRGLIFACFGNFSQAVQDFSVAINLDEKYAKPYLERAKCLQIQGNSNQAFIDLQKYITLAPQDPYIHKYAGFLLFQNCAYQDCLSAFSHGSDLPNDYELILTKAKCNFLLGHYDVALEYFQSYKERSHSTMFETDVEIIKICHEISAGFQNVNTLDKLVQRLQTIEVDFKQEQSKIFKIRDLHQIKGSIYLIKEDYNMALEEFTKTLEFFRIQKQREFEKNLVQDPNEFEEEWSEIEIKFNLSLCHLCKQEYDMAYELVSEFSESTEKGKNWEKYVELIEELLMEKTIDRAVTLDTFEQNIRISKLWPKINLPNTRVSLSMALSYPFVQPPEMMPEFDQQLFTEFVMSKVEPKPQAPWINRNNSGLVFTPNIQVYENLELSMTTKKNDDEDEEQNKPTSEIEQSISLSNSEFQLPTEDLKRKFKLDSLVEMKLNKILNK